MNTKDFDNWCKENGYIRRNDWCRQIINGYHYYFLINPTTDKFAFIEYRPEIKGSAWQAWFTVLVKDFVDFNGWADEFHKETAGVFK